MQIKRLRVKTRNVESCAIWRVQVTIAQEWFSPKTRGTAVFVLQLGNCSHARHVFVTFSSVRVCVRHTHRSFKIRMSLTVTDWSTKTDAIRPQGLCTLSALSPRGRHELSVHTALTSKLSRVSYGRSVHAISLEVEIRHIFLFLLV